MTIKKNLEFGIKQLKESKTPEIDAEVLLYHLLKKDRAWLYTHQDDALTSDQTQKYQNLISRRKKGEPLAYLTNHKEFYGLDFYVNKFVLIPRPETELLVEEALEQISNLKSKISNILDIGTGSGAVIISLAKTLKAISYKLKPKYYATDISNDALKIAKKNAKKHKVKINFIKSDLFNNISNQLKFDLIVANLPYLWDKLPQFEPKIALSGGKNGLEIINRFLEEAKNYLSPKGAIIIEFDPRQTQTIKNIAKNIYPDKKISLKKDLAKLDRMLILS